MKDDNWRALVYVLVRVGFATMAAAGIARGDYESMTIALIGLLLSVIPQLLLKRFSLKLPLLYELIIIGFIVASIMFGELFGAYSTFWWWDSMLHLSSGVVIGYIGYMILFTLHMQGKLKVSAGMIAFLTFSVSMMCAALWEIIEFSVDEFYGATMQHGNTDTMKDIILAMFGSLLATVAIYWHHRWPDNSPIKGELTSFMRKNRHLLPRRYKGKKITEGDIV